MIAATGPKANARLAQVMPSLLRHLHDFARENEITVDEWTAAVEMVCLIFGLKSSFPFLCLVWKDGFGGNFRIWSVFINL